MSRKPQLRKQHEKQQQNTKSKRQETILSRAMNRVFDQLRSDNPGLAIYRLSRWYLSAIVDRLREQFPEVPYCAVGKRSFMEPDGGVLFLQDRKGRQYPILISEKKNQGTNDLRELEGKPKQSKGNAIERLGKNVIGLRTAMLNESIFPFVCFGDGCDFADDSSIIDRVKTISMFGTLNEVHLHNEGSRGVFNRGTYFFRVEEWTEEEMYEISLDIARRSILYYFSKYGQCFFS